MDVETRDAPPQPTAVVHGQVARDALGSWLATSHGLVATHLQRIGVPTTGPPFAVVVEDGDSLNVEAGLPVPEVVDGKDEVRPAELPGGPRAVVWYRGPLDRVGDAYDMLEAWLARTGAEARGRAWQVHHEAPGADEPGDWQLEVVQPITEP
jgi:effector-binding domain-containing protein